MSAPQGRGFFCSPSPESDVGVAKNAQQEASGGARQEGGGQDHVAPGSQSGPQGDAPGVHVDRAGRLLLHALHPAGPVHLHLGGGRSKVRVTVGVLGRRSNSLTLSTSKPMGRFSPPPCLLWILLSSCCRQISTSSSSSSLPPNSNMNWSRETRR